MVKAGLGAVVQPFRRRSRIQRGGLLLLQLQNLHYEQRPRHHPLEDAALGDSRRQQPKRNCRVRASPAPLMPPRRAIALYLSLLSLDVASEAQRLPSPAS